MQTLIAFGVGLLFGCGLILAGMTNPAKVIAFLDLAGRWDPSLALVMGGAMAVASAAFALAKTRARSILGFPMQFPTLKTIDRKLVLGSVAFGIGWGLGGLCPGPAIVALASGRQEVFVFVVAMLAGMAIHELFSRKIP
ncbi:MAG: hypothetical protein FJ164_12275 [Gammaproteobacteria bacterium]|nr:hypothetical protein [Gammaproteobacteria bacterium]